MFSFKKLKHATEDICLISGREVKQVFCLLIKVFEDAVRLRLLKCAAVKVRLQFPAAFSEYSCRMKLQSLSLRRRCGAPPVY